MKVAQLAVLGVAGVAALGATYIGLNFDNKPKQEVRKVIVEAPKVELEEVLVAARDIPLGTSVQTKMLKWQPWPKEGVIDGYIIKSKKPSGLNLEKDPAIARSPFQQGEPIRESKLVRSGKGYMSAILPSGQRAVSTPISTTTGVSGFILPNDRVDVIMSRRSDESAGTEYITDTILENVRVLAIDQTIKEKNGEPVVVGETATLQLTLEQARILAVAQQLAKRVHLVLRSIEDSGNEKTSGATYLLNGKRAEGRVRIIKYGKRQEVLAGQPESN